MGKLQERDVLLEPWFSIILNGATLGENMLKYVVNVEVSEDEEKYAEAVIEVHDIAQKWITGIGIGKGSSISIKMGHRKNRATVFRGKISNIDADYPEDGVQTLVVKCVEALELTDKERSKSFKNKKVSDVIREMHVKAGLKVEVQDTKTVLENIPQTKETDAEFIHRWREKLGWKYYKKPDGTGYYFGKKDWSTAQVGKLHWRTGGMEIISFTPSFVDADTEKEDEKQLDNKKAEKKTSKNKKAPAKKASSNGSDKVKGKA